MKRQRRAAGVEHRVAGSRVAVARLAGRPGDREPLALRRQRDRHAGDRREIAGLASGCQMKELRLVHMAAKREAAVGRMQAADRLHAPEHIRPLGRRERVGVDEQTVRIGHDQRQ